MDWFRKLVEELQGVCCGVIFVVCRQVLLLVGVGVFMVGGCLS